MMPQLDPMHILALHCPQCPFLTLSMTRLFEHCLSHEESVDCTLYQCTQCGIVGTHLGILEVTMSNFLTFFEGLHILYGLCRSTLELGTHLAKILF